jgi:hypothetical protein
VGANFAMTELPIMTINAAEVLAISVPNVQIGSFAAFLCPDNGVLLTADSNVAIQWESYPVVVANNIHPSMLDPALDLRLELLRYCPKKKSYKSDFGYKFIRARYAHPQNQDGLTWPHNGADTHNGNTYGTSANRITEWVITQRNQKVGINLAQFFKVGNIRFRDPSNVDQTVQALIPTTKRVSTPFTYPPRKGLTRNFAPQFFAFRYSILDVNKGVGRVTGPISHTLVASHKYSPVVEDINYQVANNGVKAYNLNSSFNINVMKVSFDRRHV